MIIQLSRKEERGQNQYESFEGRPIDQMPILIEQGYEPASIATIIERRENAPEEVKKAWQYNWFWTGDAASTDNTGGAVLTLDAPFLRRINPESPLLNGVLKLTDEQWEEIRNSEYSLILSPEEVEQAHGKGYVFQRGAWQPQNSVVGKVWQGTDSFPGLAKGRNVASYAQMVSEASNLKNVLNVYFDQSKPEAPAGRSVVVDSIGNNSNVYGYDNLHNESGRLAGVAPEAQQEVKGAKHYPKILHLIH